MKIVIIGVGGVGGYFGAKLAKAGEDVTFIARGEHLKAIQAKGLIVKSILGNFELSSVSATDNPENVKNPDLIIIAVKAWQVKDVARTIASIVNDNTVILPLQNGILAADELSNVIDKKNVLGGLCRIISKIEAPGVINHFGVEPTIVFGELMGGKSERTTQILELFTKASIKAKIAEDIHSELWKKFIAICVGGLLAVTRSNYGELREIKETRKMMYDLCEEIYLLSQKVGISIESDFIEKTIAFIDSFPYDATSSMARDIWEGRPSEIEYQNGTVFKLAEKYELDTPVNRFIYHCILPQERKARGN